ncbi:hypothetical protein NP493_159g04043 [Ridgeia piscesae]|uniref:Centrosomal protein of 89 kDa n=1 Tax=Ridgeia piscesae TaxID=27915 RepID=A0AAD9P3U4_RIDPI|nr:hypothetical protein NP493_159g04043 [Ridgeia piscesae]
MHSGPPNTILHTLGTSGCLSTSGFELPREDLQTDETDTSLYDYQNARDTFAYSSIHYGESGDRVSLATPPPPPQFDDGYRSPDSGKSYFHSHIMSKVKCKSRSRSPFSTKGSSMRRYDQDDSRAIGRMSPHNSVRFSDTFESESRNTMSASLPRWQVNDTGRTTTVESNRTGQSQMGSTAYVASPRLTSLERKQAKLQHKQKDQEQQLDKQKQMYLSVSMRLKQTAAEAMQQSTPEVNEMGSLLQESLNVTGNTMRKQEDYVKSYEERILIFQQENEELRQLNEQLQAEVNSVQRMASFTDPDSSSGSQNVMKKKIQDYKNDNDTLRACVHKLNAELSRYQANFRQLTSSEMEELPGLPLKGPKPSWLLKTKYLAPLLVAYDDQLREKEEIVNNYQEELSHLRQSVEDVVKENERLHLRIEQTDISGPTSMTEWRQLQEQCKLVLEENQLLMEQLDVHQSKTRDMHTAHVQEVAKLTQQLAVSCAGRKELEEEVDKLRRQCDDLKQQLDTAAVDSKCNVALSDHMMTVSQLKRSQEDDQMKRDTEISELSIKVKTLMADNKGLSQKVEQLRSEKKQLQASEKSLHKVIRKAQRKILTLEKDVEQAKCSEYTVDHYLTKVISAAKESQVEMETYVSAVLEQAENNKATLDCVLGDKTELVKRMHKNKVSKQKLSENLDKALHRVKEQEEEMNRQKQQFDLQLKHLRLLITEKDDMLDLLSGEKKQVECDLETMWQATSADNRRMKASVKKTIQKLKGHPNLHDLVSNIDDDDSVI